MHKKLLIFLKIGIIATFFMPLIVAPQSYIFPFIVPKALFFRSSVLLITGLYILLLAADWQRYKPRFTPVAASVAFFLVSVFVSTVFGVDSYRSLWDNHERMLGLFTILHYGLLFLIVSSVIKTWAEWRQLCWWFLGAGSMVMFIGVLQKINPELLLNRGADRVSATLGNAIYYSGYGLFLMFVGSLLTVTAGKKWTVTKWLSLVGAALGFLGIFLGGTRGTLVGLILALGVISLSYALTLKDHPRIRRAAWGVIAGGVIVIALLFSFRHTEFVRGIPAIGRLVNTSLVNDSANTRIMAWRVAVVAWQEKPIFGWGPNNFYYAFNKYYPPEFLRHGWGETWFDNAHNVVMNTVATQGIVGLIAYVGLFGIGVWSLWRGYRRGVVPLHVATLTTGFFVGHFVHNLFVFENLTSYLYFFFVVALVQHLAWPEAPVTANGKSATTKPVSGGLAITVGLVVLLLIYSTNIRPKQANNATFHTIQAMYQSTNTAMELYKKTLAIPSPHIDDVRNDVGRVASGIIPQLIQAGSTDLAKEWLMVAYDGLEKNLQLHPLDIRVGLQLGQLAEQRAQLFDEPGYMVAAERIYEDTLTKSPKRQQIQFALGLVKLKLGKYDEAISLVQVARDNDPVISESWWRLAWMYGAAGQTEKARAVIAEAREKGVEFDDQGQAIVNQILGS